jgi:hypothetical protein
MRLLFRIVAQEKYTEGRRIGDPVGGREAREGCAEERDRRGRERRGGRDVRELWERCEG